MRDLLNDIHTEESYIEMVSEKSAALIAAACMVGTLLATGERSEEVRLYAEHLGIAAQIKNDIRDLLNWDHKNDFLNRKRTLPTLYLIQSVGKVAFVDINLDNLQQLCLEEPLTDIHDSIRKSFQGSLQQFTEGY
ncbi:polyprenyl synthetase family protein [Paenibacillus ihumii]|uniref:polyprenyl synthetase family protein n=1 Tax=Paenibacillus ihumii TaxID=687436 RepID=UPI00093ABF98|nr:polyprenyl synthetase family protein [Paenibacillus ihumii]